MWTLPDFILFTLIITTIIYLGSVNWESQFLSRFAIKTYFNFAITTIVLWSLFIWILISFVFFSVQNWPEIKLYFEILTVDEISFLFKILVIGSVIIIIYNSITYIFNNRNIVTEFILLVCFSGFFLILMISSLNLIAIFLCILGSSILIYSKLGLDKQNHNAREAVLKYFILSSLVTGMFALCISNILLIFLTTNSFLINISLSTWFEWSFYFSTQYHTIIAFTITVLIFSFFFKLSAFPGHLWVTDIYQGSSNPLMNFFIITLKLAIFFTFSRLLTWTFDSMSAVWSVLIYFSALFSMIFGALNAAIETNFKKLLAYGSINQIGLILVGLSCKTYEGIEASFIYIIIYTITNTILFIIFCNTRQVLSQFPITYIKELGNLVNTNMLAGVLLTMALFSMAGIPPLTGFFSKYFIFLQAFRAKYFFLILIGMGTSLISTVYYLNIINKMLLLKFLSTKSYFLDVNLLGKLILTTFTVVIMYMPIVSLIEHLIILNELNILV